MILFAIALLCTGGLVALISGIWTLALAFQRHVLWGLAVLVVPVGNVAFLCFNWREARVPFFLGLLSLFFVGSALVSMPRESLTVPWHALTAAFAENQQMRHQAADDKMEKERIDAEVQMRLVSLKRKEALLMQRKAALAPADRQGAEELSSEIRRYNAELQPILAQAGGVGR